MERKVWVLLILSWSHRVAVIQQVIDLYVAVVKMDTGIIIKIDQSHLETVIPAIGSKIAIVNGRFRGHVGTLQHVDFDRYKVTVLVEGKEIEKEYEEVCKIWACV